MPHGIVFRLVVLAAFLALASPVAAQAAEDPFETTNRQVHQFNQAARTRVIVPLVELYLSFTSAEVRRGVSNALANLGEPVTVLSGLAAGEGRIAAHAAARFAINSTLGLAGIQDRATAMGYPHRSFSVADAICSWGVPRGPFVVLPLLGPSTLRDTGALVTMSVALSQAVGADAYSAWATGAVFDGYVRHHHDLERIEAESLDAYALQRSAYLQRRATACLVDQASAATETPEAPPPAR